MRMHPLRNFRCCSAQVDSYFGSHILRCSSENARTCSGSSAPRNSTPAGSGSGLNTLSGVGIFGGLLSMMVLLYEFIMSLGARRALALPHTADVLARSLLL